MKYSILLLIFIGKLYADEFESEYGRLIFVSTVFRHGDKTPEKFFPTDPYYSRLYWPEGYGQLTNRGKQQLFEMGKWFRKSYREILGEKYDADTIHVISSDVDRTMMSAECFLAGLYPPNEYEIWTPELNWQPIPVHTVPSEDDTFMAGTAECEVLDNEIYIINRLPKFRRYYDEHKNVIQYILKNAGFDVDEGDVYSSLKSVSMVSDTIVIEDIHNLTLPFWTIPIYPNQIREIELVKLEACWYTKKQKRLQIGVLLDIMIRSMREKIQDTSEPNRTLVVYSAHEHSVFGLWRAFELYFMHKVPYAGNMIFELRRKENDYNVLVKYRNNTEDAFVLNLPRCQTPCHFDNFVKSVEEYIPDDWRMECRVKKLENFSFLSAIQAIALLICIFVIIWICFRCVKKRMKTKKYEYV